MTTRDAPHRCTKCGTEHEAVTNARAGDHKAPSPGDASICFRCSWVMVFAEDMTMRDPTPEEKRQFDADPHIRRIRRIHRQFRAAQERRSGKLQLTPVFLVTISAGPGARFPGIPAAIAELH